MSSSESFKPSGRMASETGPPKLPREASRLEQGCGDNTSLSSLAIASAEDGRVGFGVLGGAAQDPDCGFRVSDELAVDAEGPESLRGNEFRVDMNDLNSEVSKSSFGTTI